MKTSSISHPENQRRSKFPSRGNLENGIIYERLAVDQNGRATKYRPTARSNPTFRNVPKRRKSVSPKLPIFRTHISISFGNAIAMCWQRPIECVSVRPDRIGRVEPTRFVTKQQETGRVVRV